MPTAPDDDFVFTGKDDGFPPVMPTMDEFDPLVLPGGFGPAQDFVMTLALEGPQVAYDHNLTLLDEWLTAPSRSAAWE